MKKFWNWIHDDGGGRVLRLEGPIDEESFWGDEITPADFRSELEAEEGDVTVWINSPGGNVFAAAEIYTMLREYAGSITVRIASIAASAASVVAMAGDRVEMSPTALLMIHDPSTIAMGNAKDMEKAIETLNEVKESIINAYAAKSGMRRGRIAELMSNETWMNAKKAVEMGFADEILYDGKKPSEEEHVLMASQRNIKLICSGTSAGINADRRLVREMIDNLLQNAIRYNKENGTVKVHVTIENGHPMISVEDTGIGIPADQLDRVFERFYRVDKSRSRETGGTGLGLAIVKHIAELHSAEIAIHSIVDEGTEIVVRF